MPPIPHLFDPAVENSLTGTVLGQFVVAVGFAAIFWALNRLRHWLFPRAVVVGTGALSYLDFRLFVRPYAIAKELRASTLSDREWLSYVAKCSNRLSTNLLRRVRPHLAAKRRRERVAEDPDAGRQARRVGLTARR